MITSDFKKYKDYILLDKPIKFGDAYEVVGFFPYSVASIRHSGPKVPRALFAELENVLSKARVMDNKVVIICRDLVNFGTDDFAIQFHDLGCRVGALKEVIGYAGSALTIKLEIQTKIMGAICTCGNTDHKKNKHYDGCLGYEALVCTVCGRYLDHLSETPHEADDWSLQFIGSKAVLVKSWHKSGEYAYAQCSPVNCEKDRLIIKAETEAEALKFFNDNKGFGRTGNCPPYVVSKQWKDGVLVCLSTYCGYD